MNKKVTQDDIELLLKQVTDKIEHYGHIVMSVFSTEARIDHEFSYTVGLERSYRHPEIIVFGLPPDVAHVILNDIGERIKNGLRIEDGLRDDTLAVGLPVMFRTVPGDQFAKHLNLAKRMQNEFRAYQMIWPDPAGLFPWDEGFDENYRNTQPLLYSKVH